MIRKQMYFTDYQDKEIRKASKKTGLSFSDIVRRCLDYCIHNNRIEYISTMKSEKDDEN